MQVITPTVRLCGAHTKALAIYCIRGPSIEKCIKICTQKDLLFHVKESCAVPSPMGQTLSGTEDTELNETQSDLPGAQSLPE